MTILVSRRSFLGGVGGACAAGIASPLLRPQLALAADGVTDHTLVVVVLGGGLDGISALVPAGDPDYARQRRSTLIPSEQLLAVDDMFGLHPSLHPIHDLWIEGLVAAIPAVGTSTTTRSHFSELATIAAGTSGQSSDGSGWLARHLRSQAGGVDAVLAGTSMGPVPALELQGHAGAFHVRDLFTVGLDGWTSSDRTRAEASLASAYRAAAPELASAAATAFDAMSRLRSIDPASVQPPTSGGTWAWQLAQVAAMVRADVGVAAAVVQLPGWDTHRAQGGPTGQLAGQLGDLAFALDRLATDLADRLDRVTIVVLSEFGRRVIENDSGGTDHGRGGLALVIGGGIHGGVHGTWPSLAGDALDQGDVAVATDIRSVLAEVVQRRLGNDALDVVFPGFTPAPVGLA